MTSASLNPVELIGYLASLLVFSTFYMKTMIPLRSVAIASNVAFITYGYLAGLYPVFLLHVVLLPLNIWRLYQMRKLLARVRQASKGEYSIESMMPFMTKIDFKKADVIFRQGEAADKLYYLVSGSIRFPEIEANAVPGDIIGEVGVFSPWKSRTASAVAESDSMLLTLSDQKVLELYYQNPEFGIYIVRMIIQHFIHQVRVGRAKALVPPERFE
jgi:CRP/FNR family cyclic AMP-dependent transcriptional regulator